MNLSQTAAHLRPLISHTNNLWVPILATEKLQNTRPRGYLSKTLQGYRTGGQHHGFERLNMFCRDRGDRLHLAEIFYYCEPFPPHSLTVSHTSDPIGHVI